MVLLLLVFGWASAQENHLTTDFNLSDDVEKYESVEYRYASLSNTYEPSVSETRVFKNGKLQSATHKESGTSILSHATQAFEYNAKGQLLKTTQTLFSSPIVQHYVYDAKGKLIQIKPDKDAAPVEENFTYDAKGRLQHWVKRNGTFTDKEKIIYDCKDAQNYRYVLKHYQYKKNELLFSEEGIVQNGLKTATKTTFKDGKVTEMNFTYDSHKNLISEKSVGGSEFRTLYGYDFKGNVVKSKSVEDGKLYAKFIKLTFKDGTVSGSTDFQPFFSEGIQRPVAELPINKNPKDTFKVKKTTGTDFEVINKKGEKVSLKPSEGLVFNNTDFIFYDANTKETGALMKLYTDQFQANTFYDLVPFNSPSGKYIVVNTDMKFFIFEKGNVIDGKPFKIFTGIDGNTLVITENDTEKYFVPNLKSLQALTIYPLEIIAK